ncbi:hypothetical protein, partial [Achromobacter xylosoxidans]
APMTLVTTDLYRSIAWLVLGTRVAFGLGLWLALRLANRLTSAASLTRVPGSSTARPCCRRRACWRTRNTWRTTIR